MWERWKKRGGGGGGKAVKFGALPTDTGVFVYSASSREGNLHATLQLAGVGAWVPLSAAQGVGSDETVGVECGGHQQ